MTVLIFSNRLFNTNPVIVKKDTEKGTGKKIQKNTEDMASTEEMVQVQEETFDQQHIERKKLEDEVRQVPAEKDEQISEVSKSLNDKTVAHLETMDLLNSTKADLHKSYHECEYLEEKLHRTDDNQQRLDIGDHTSGGQSEEEVETHVQEPSTKEEALKLQILEKEQQIIEKFKNVKEEFEKQLLEVRENNKKELREREERMRQQLEEKDTIFKKQLSMLSEFWENRSQQWSREKAELLDKLQEQENRRKQHNEEIQRETERLREAIQQLQVSSCQLHLC